MERVEWVGWVGWVGCGGYNSPVSLSTLLPRHLPSYHRRGGRSGQAVAIPFSYKYRKYRSTYGMHVGIPSI